jgi:membrane-associated protease RseP (regulator of RpoE activity)
VFPEDLIASAGPSNLTEEAPRSRFTPEPSPPGPPKRRLWLHLLLLLLTMFTTTLVGAQMQYNFAHNLPFFDGDRYFDVIDRVVSNASLFEAGIPFSMTLLAILMAHEMGHYLACVYYDVDATLPFFLPAPTLIGTFGAFIRIRSPIYSKRTLFDIGIAGPLAGFIFLVPALGAGLAFSKVIPGIGHQGTIQMGTPALLWCLEKLIFPGVPSADIYLHPVARAAWVGMFATGLNLLPIGQLDGGHIVYALLGRSHKRITQAFLLLLLPMGVLWWEWWLLAVLFFFLARRHPPVYDESWIGFPRVKLGVLALAVFILCFSIAPVNG